METSPLISMQAYDIAETSRNQEPGILCPWFCLCTLVMMSRFRSLYLYTEGG
jgi:hypothetical protein